MNTIVQIIIILINNITMLIHAKLECAIFFFSFKSVSISLEYTRIHHSRGWGGKFFYRNTHSYVDYIIYPQIKNWFIDNNIANFFVGVRGLYMWAIMWTVDTSRGWSNVGSTCLIDPLHTISWGGPHGIS